MNCKRVLEDLYRHEELKIERIRLRPHLFAPLKSIGVTRTTHADLDTMQEKRIGDHWTVDVTRSLSNSWKGFTKFTYLAVITVVGFLVNRIVSNSAAFRSFLLSMCTDAPESATIYLSSGFRIWRW